VSGQFGKWGFDFRSKWRGCFTRISASKEEQGRSGTMGSIFENQCPITSTNGLEAAEAVKLNWSLGAGAPSLVWSCG
jgi:hypothetical protein